MTCFVKDCKSVRRLLTPETKILFHRFPTDEETFQGWLRALGRDNEDITWSRSRYICSKHFRPEDVKIVGNKRVLKESVLPVLYLQGSEEVASSSTSHHI